MNTDYIANITETLCLVDEFCKQIEPQFKKKAIGEDGKKRRNRAFKMSDSEIITILILFHLSGYRTLKAFYTQMICKEWRHTFPLCSLTIALWNVSKWFLSNFICFSATVVWAIAPASQSLIPPHSGVSRQALEKAQNLPWICHKRQRDDGEVLRFQTAHHYQRPRRNCPMAVDTSQYR